MGWGLRLARMEEGVSPQAFISLCLMTEDVTRHLVFLSPCLPCCDGLSFHNVRQKECLFKLLLPGVLSWLPGKSHTFLKYGQSLY